MQPQHGSGTAVCHFDILLFKASENRLFPAKGWENRFFLNGNRSDC